MPPRVANKPEAQPEIHLHGDIHVHTYHDGSASVAIDPEAKKLVEEVAQMSYTEPRMDTVNEAAMPQAVSPRMAFDKALDQLSSACDFLEDRINLLGSRTAPVRNQEDSPAYQGPSGFSNESSSEVMKLMNSIWCRIQVSGWRIDNICSELET